MDDLGSTSSMKSSNAKYKVKLAGRKTGFLRTALEFNPLVPMVPLSGLVLKEKASVVESVRNLDAKCEVQGSACTFCS